MDTGDSVGPYLIHGSLGAGGMGRVYRARDTRLEREVALKHLSDPSLTNDAARRRILHEARLAAGLSHPNIATIYDVLDTADGPTIVMEYVPGDSLGRRIGRGRIPLTEALGIATQIADGLAAAHARGIIHRDLKPANIQITPDGTPKILDFGIAQVRPTEEEQAAAPTRTSDLQPGRLSGTLGYMAPEQLGGGAVDARTDVYALGVVLYEMLTGRRPFPASDLLGNAMAVLKGDAPSVVALVPSTPSHVSALIARAMAREPSARFQTAADLAAALRGAPLSIAGSAESARRAGLPRVAVVGIAAVVALGVLAAGWVWSQRADPDTVAGYASAVAVLPFANTTADPADDPLAVGLTEAVANRLSSLRSFRVLSLAQTREAVGNGRDPGATARTLGAGFVVEGGVRRAGQSLDVDVAIVDAGGRRRPAGRYTGTMGQMFDLHQRITQGLIAALAEASEVPAPIAPSRAPTSNQEAFAEYAQARLFLERPDDVDHAIRLFQSAIAKDERFALAHAGLGQAYWSKYRQTQDTEWTTRATASIIEGLRIDPDQPEVRLSLAVMYQGLGRRDAAEEEVRRVLALQPWNDDAHRLMAGIHIDHGEWDAAVQALTQAIALRPNYWRNHSELGFAHYSAGRLDQSVAAYERVVELQPDSALGFHMLGTVHQSAGRLADALVNYGKATAIRPRPTTYSNTGTIHFWSGDYARAVEAYQGAIALSANTPELHANLGDALKKLGQRDRARASYQNAVDRVRQQLAVNDKDAERLSLLALYLAKLEDWAGADDASAKALAVTAEDGGVLYTLAMVDALARRSDPACAKLDKAVTRGASRELIRRADELRGLKGCEAYDRIVLQ